MIAVAEVVGLPLLAAIFVAWVRADDADALQTDAYLDAMAVNETALSSLVVDQGGVGSGAPGSAPAASPGPVLDRPWWETDPRFSDRRP